MVWIVEWSQPGQSEFHASAWLTEADALKSACGEMLISINDHWDLDDADALDAAHKVNDLVAAGDYQKALNEYSDYESERNDYEYSQYWSVSERNVNTHPKPPALLILESLDDEEEYEDEEDDDDEEEDEDEIYQASVPGATCRGPCKTINEHAYADRIDGTHVCYQCKLMSQVFGGTIK